MRLLSAVFPTTRSPLKSSAALMGSLLSGAHREEDARG